MSKRKREKMESPEKPRACIIDAPGTSCSWSVKSACEKSHIKSRVLSTSYLKENPHILHSFDMIFLPGGASHGDYLGAGVMLAHELAISLGDELNKFAESGKFIVGICNGFQILTRLGLIPGLSLVPNKFPGMATGVFHVKVNKDSSACIASYLPDKMSIPINHREGRVVVRDAQTFKRMKENGQILFQWSDYYGVPSNASAFNPNGSVYAIAAACNEQGNVIGMMPHPERPPSYVTRSYMGYGLYGEGLAGDSSEKEEEINPGLAIFHALRFAHEDKKKG